MKRSLKSPGSRLDLSLPREDVRDGEEGDGRHDVHQLEHRRHDHQQIKVLTSFFRCRIVLVFGFYLISVQIALWPLISQETRFFSFSFFLSNKQ